MIRTRVVIATKSLSLTLFHGSFETPEQYSVFYYLTRYHFLNNTYHVAGECRRQEQNVTNVVKNVKIVECPYHIQNPREKCIQIGTNMPCVGLVIPEITCEMLEF